MILETEIIKVKGPIGVGKAVARVNGKLACYGRADLCNWIRGKVMLFKKYISLNKNAEETEKAVEGQEPEKKEESVVPDRHRKSRRPSPVRSARKS